MKCVIIGGADDVCCTAEDIQSYALVIAADRGYDHCRKLGIKPDVILGDFDSFSGDIADTGAEIVRLPTAKDDTDTLYAVKYAAERFNADDFVIYGGTGGRLGHTFANIQTLSFISAMGMKGVLSDSSSDVYVQSPSDGRREYSRKNGETAYISIFSLTDSAEVLLEGVRYSGRIILYRNYIKPPMGVSNEYSGEDNCGVQKCAVTVESGEILLIFEKAADKCSGSDISE